MRSPLDFARTFVSLSVMRRFSLALVAAAATACSVTSAENAAKAPSPSSSAAPNAQPGSKPAAQPVSTGTSRSSGGTVLAPPPEPGLAVATFAGGCFWCMEGPFEKLKGVKAVFSGYTGGPEKHPTYRQVGSGRTGHTEAVRVIYDPDFVTYSELLEVFWMQIDPTDAGGQFVDRGSQYRTGIFVHDETQRTDAEASKKELVSSKRFKKPIVTPILPAEDFWLAEDYHQDFYRKNAAHYQRYRKGSGRVDFIRRHWGPEAAH